MQVKKLLTPRDFWWTIRYHAYGNYLKRDRAFREGLPGEREWEEYRKKAYLFMLDDWFQAVKDVQHHYAVVPVNPKQIAELAYYLWEDRQREGIPGTPEGNWLEAEEQLARARIIYPERVARDAA